MLGAKWEADEDRARRKRERPDDDPTRHFGEAARPREATLSALRELDKLCTIADLVRSKYSWIGPSLDPPNPAHRYYSSAPDWWWRR